VQAEDGIRARNVTGVQTCALPILLKVYEKLITGKIDLKEKPFNLSIRQQKIWSDRLPASSAKTSAHLLNDILNDRFSKRQNTILHNLLEWPMLLSEKNKEN